VSPRDANRTLLRPRLTAAYNELRVIMSIVRGPLGRLVLFIAAAAASLAVAIPVGSTVIGVLGGVRQLAAMAAITALASAGMLLATMALLRVEGATLGALGLPLDRRRLGELAAGFVVTCTLFLAVAGVQSVMVGAGWQFTGARGLLDALVDLPLVLCLVVGEELLFRGAALRLLRALAGDRAAIAITALVFGAYHVLGTQYWGMGLAFQFVMPAIGGLLFAWAAVRSGGLALPIGLHLGGNWVQSSVAVFALRPAPAGEPLHGLWQIPITASDAQVLTAPDILPRLPLLLAFAIAAALTAQQLRRPVDAQPFALPKQ
jgi:membrane protease YdiL (CAAX protease family)